MAGELLLINPRRRRSTRKTRSPAQKAATRRMLAANRARRGSNPVRKIRRRRAASSLTARHVRRNPVRRYRSRARRRNPISMGGIGGMFMPAFKGALGSIVADFAVAKLIPDTLVSNPWMRYAVRGAAAIGLSMVGTLVVNRATANQMASGALTVVLRDMVSDLAGTAGLSLSGMGYYAPAYQVPAAALPGGYSNPYANMDMSNAGMYVS